MVDSQIPDVITKVIVKVVILNINVYQVMAVCYVQYVIKIMFV